MELRARLATITRLHRYRKLLEGRANMEAVHARLMDAYDGLRRKVEHYRDAFSD